MVSCPSDFLPSHWLPSSLFPDWLPSLPLGEDPGSERGDVAGRLRAVPRQDRGRDPAGRSRDLVGRSPDLAGRSRDETYSMVRSRDHPRLGGHVT